MHMNKRLVDLEHCFPQLGPEPSQHEYVCMISKQYPTDTCAANAPLIYDEFMNILGRGYDGMLGNLTRKQNACVREALVGIWTRLRRNILREYFGVGSDVDIPSKEVDALLFDALPCSFQPPPSKKADGAHDSRRRRMRSI